MVVIAFFVARYFSQSWDVNAIEDTQLARVETVQLSLQKSLSEGIAVDRALRRVSKRGRLNLMVINSATNEFILGFPPQLLEQQTRFIGLKEAQQPLLIRNRNMEFIGPLLVQSKGQDYQLFVGHLLRRDQRPYFAFAIALGVFLIMGTVACVAISWTIVKPIKELSKLSKNFAQGGVIEETPSKKGVAGNETDLFEQRRDELGQLHNDIYDMASKLAKSLLQQKALMANISHELRTPLTRLQLALAMLDPAEGEQQRYASRIEKDIGVMDALIGQALQLAKANDETNAQWLQSEEVVLHEFLLPILDDLRFEASAGDTILDVNNTTADDLRITLIKTSFISAIENVTRNAIKYSAKKVCVNVDVLDSTATLPATLRLSIEDDGQGLSSDQLTQIFEPFYRASTQTEYQGTGLGLAIAKACVELHNGSIQAQASDMGGIRLTLLFPITR
jgi:two-component system sensor histidine kinase CpxA